MTVVTIQIYTDGSCIGNPGPGGWAALIRKGSEEEFIKDGAPHTTNNRMELTAVIEALKYAAETFPGENKYEVYSDSSWVINTMTKNWKRKKNLDLWAEMDSVVADKSIMWEWVRGHNGHPENEACDERALEEAKHYAEMAKRMNPEDLTYPGEMPKLF